MLCGGVIAAHKLRIYPRKIERKNYLFSCLILLFFICAMLGSVRHAFISALVGCGVGILVSANYSVIQQRREAIKEEQMRQQMAEY